MPNSQSPDWDLLVRERLKDLKLPPQQVQEVIMELASHLEEIYEGLCAEGLCKSEAMQRSLKEIIDAQQLSRRIQSAKREEGFMNDRTRQFWLPALVSLAISEGTLLLISITVGTHFQVWRLGPMAMWVPWLISLPAAG